MLISDATREQIRAASDIVDVIGSYLPLKRAGANFTALCPFHKEKTPSFSVNAHLQIFKCFGCQKGGDVFTFIMEYESVDFPEALKRLADRAKIPLEFEQGGPEQQNRHLKDTLFRIHEQITQRWQGALANEAQGQIARDYLAKRGVSAEAIKLFRLGYAPELWDDTLNWGKGKGFEPEFLDKAGLIIRREGNEGFYDRFRGRLMFPICDEQGRVIGFSGRILTGEEKVAKYVNSPETLLFTKSKVFFGLDKSKRAILDAGFAVVCEGQLDLIACFTGGVQNIVAPQGTAFTADHARILKRYVDELVLCFDSDNAGQNAAIRALDHLLASGLAVRVATIPAPHDPDTFIKSEGADAFKQLIAKAEGFFDFYLGRLCRTNDLTADKGRLAVLRDMAEAVHKTGNGVLIDKYAQKTALKLGVDPNAVRAEFRKSGRGQKVPATELPDEKPVEADTLPPVPEAERWLMRILLTHEELVPWIAERIDLRWIRHSAARQILEARLRAFQANAWTNVAAFLSELPSPQYQQLVTDAITRPMQDPEKTLKGDPLHSDKRGVLERLRDEFIDVELNALKHRTNQPELTDEQRLGLLKQQEGLRLAKRTPMAEAEAGLGSDPGMRTTQHE
jgi:DNA primase